MKGTFQIPGTFPETFNLDIVVQVIILVQSLKRETELMAKVNLGQTRLTHVSKSYTLPECTNKRGDEGTFYMVQKRELFQ